LLCRPATKKQARPTGRRRKKMENDKKENWQIEKDEKIKKIIFPPTERDNLENKIKTDPLHIFITLPNCEIRKKCLKVMNSDFGVGEDYYMAGWAEACIIALWGNNRDYDSFYEEIMNWYINTSLEQNIFRSTEFAIKFYKKNHSPLNLIKVIARKLVNTYPFDCILTKIPSLKDFLEKNLNRINCNKYIESNWVDVERVFRIIARFTLIDFLPKINELINKMELGLINPDLFNQPKYLIHLKEIHMIHLKDMRDLLRKIKKEQMKEEREITKK
jgi:hypothetical protein